MYFWQEKLIQDNGQSHHTTMLSTFVVSGAIGAVNSFINTQNFSGTAGSTENLDFRQAFRHLDF